MLFKIIDISYGWFDIDINRQCILTNSDYLGCDAPALLLDALADLMEGTKDVEWLCWQDEPGAHIIKLMRRDQQLICEVYLANRDSFDLEYRGEQLAKHLAPREHIFKDDLSEVVKAVVMEFGLYEKGNGRQQYRIHWGDFPHREYGRLKQLLHMTEFNGTVPEGTLNGYQKKFFRYMGVIQDVAVQTAISKYGDLKTADEIEDLLYDVTYSVIMDLMVMIDGYSSFSNEKMELINQNSGVGLKENPFIELHDAICEFIKYEK